MGALGGEIPREREEKKERWLGFLERDALLFWQLIYLGSWLFNVNWALSYSLSTGIFVTKFALYGRGQFPNGSDLLCLKKKKFVPLYRVVF